MPQNKEYIEQIVREYLQTRGLLDHTHTNDKVQHSDLLGNEIGDPHEKYIKVDGTRAFTGEQSMGTNKLTNVVDPTSNQDASTKKYGDTNFIHEAGTNPFTGEQSMGTNKLTNVVDPGSNQDAATKKYVDDSIPGYVAGDNLIVSSDGSFSHAGTSYLRVKEVGIARAGTLRIEFGLKTSNGSYIAYGRIYKNGGAVGTVRSTTETSYQTYAEDISGLAKGDLVQLYTKSESGFAQAGIINYRIYANAFEVATVTYDASV